MKSSKSLSAVALGLLLMCTSIVFAAQDQRGMIAGVVTDPSGAVMPNVQVVVSSMDGSKKSANTDDQGRFTLAGLSPGQYLLRVSAPGFAIYETRGLSIIPGGKLTLKVTLAIAPVNQEVSVADTRPVDVEPTNNASAVTLRGADLNALSNDRDDLAEDLRALAGPAAGPNGGEIFVDGFSGGRLPAKASIREIRVNQNPFSAEYDRLGFGRIEIFTKPGADKFRGEASFNLGDSLFNSRNPFAPDKPHYQRRMMEGNLSGPLTKLTSFSLQLERRDIGETSVINALVLDPSLNVTSFRQAVLSPTVNTEISLRIDHQLSARHTLVGRYEWEDRTQTSAGLDTSSLPSRASDRTSRDHMFQITETAVLSPKAIHEVRFQYARSRNTSTFASMAPAVQVPEAFVAGGSAGGPSAATEKRWELSDVLSLSRSKHMIKLGGRLRSVGQTDMSMSRYNGLFTFTSLDAYRITELGLRNGLTSAQIRAQGGGASQFSIVTGDPSASVSQMDAGLFIQDDWRILRQFTLSAGLRYELQNNIRDRHSLAPRVGFAWALGSESRRQPIAVIRGGFGVFYDRVSQNLTLDTIRLDGMHQREYLVTDPDFYPDIPQIASVNAILRQQAIRKMAGNLRAPYILQTVFSVEKQLPKNIALSLTYSNSRGIHMLRSRNINAPLPGSYDPTVPGSGIRPYGDTNIYLYESSGIFKQDQLIANVNRRFSSRLSMTGFYVWGKANSDTDGAGSFPANQYNMGVEYGRAGFDVRHRILLSGNITAPYGISLSPFVVANSGQPFSITIGRDLNGDSLFNDRPAWASDPSRPSVVQTPYGIFDTSPLPGQAIIYRNLGNGPSFFAVNLRLSKTFGFGEGTSSGGSSDDHHQGGPPIGGGPGGGHGGPGSVHMDGHGDGGAATNNRYTLTFSVSARNLFNNVNLAPPVGNLSSPSFGSSVALAGGGRRGGGASANRTVELQVRFSF